MAGLSNGIILILGIYAVFEGQQTIGTLAAFQAFLQLCFSPMTSFAQGLQAAQEMKGNVERVQDVLEYEDDPLLGGAALPGSDVLPETVNVGRLTGRLCVRDISFGYSPVTEPLIRNFSMEAKPGKGDRTGRRQRKWQIDCRKAVMRALSLCVRGSVI